MRIIIIITTFQSLEEKEEDMNQGSEPDIIEVDGGGGGDECGENASGNSSSPSPGSAIAGVGSDGGGGAEWQMVTRAEAKGGGAKKSGAFDFKVASAAERKRKAENSVDDRLLGLTETIEGLMTSQREMTETQKQMTESQRVLMETIMAQAEEIKTLKTMVADNKGQPSYSEAVTGHKAMDSAAGRTTQTDKTRSVVTKHGSPRVRDERAVLLILVDTRARRTFYCHQEGFAGQSQGQQGDTEVDDQVFAARTRRQGRRGVSA